MQGAGASAGTVSVKVSYRQQASGSPLFVTAAYSVSRNSGWYKSSASQNANHLAPSARPSRTPAVRAAQTPLLVWCSATKRWSPAAMASQSAGESSVEPSSTRMHRKPSNFWAAIASVQAVRNAAALCTGTMTAISQGFMASPRHNGAGKRLAGPRRSCGCHIRP